MKPTLESIGGRRGHNRAATSVEKSQRTVFSETGDLQGETLMAGWWTVDRFPQFELAIRSLTEQHRELEDEPLHLALSYLPAQRDQQDIYLLEVIGTPSESINPDRDWLEATFQSAPGFPMDFDEALHLVLTNPHEVNVALEQHWPLAVEVVNAIREGDYRVLYQDKIGEEVFAKLQAEASLQGLFRG